MIFDALLYTYAYAFMFSKTESFIAVAIYNIAFYITMVGGFYVNGLLLRVFSSKQLHIWSSILQALAILAIFFFPTINLLTIGVAGLLSGFFSGIYWAMRNTVYLFFTTDENRHYFEGLRVLLGTSSNTLLVAAAGWFIATSEVFSFMSKTLAYQFVGVFGVLIMVVGTLQLLRVSFPKISVKKLRPTKITPQWKLFRIFILVSAVQFTLTMTVPETIILYFLGNEGVLGTLQAIFIIFSTTIIYFLGRKSSKHHRVHILLASAVPLALISGLVLFFHNPILIILYLLIMNISDRLFWFVYFPIFSRAVEYETTNSDEEYAYILDHEILIDFSRVVTTLLYILLIQYFGDVNGMFIALAGGALMQVLTVAVARPLLRMQNQSQI
ncbi:MAG: hypothetical protein COY80_01960 [Candidatus Pacebacteria bacterium CG_4_10_14_0_8_um_filter_42_14]|nr:MAG: hypothetical protein COY80_01960 [Candidatus Pacebacteria bacterium CG_4_10_14_0_8_um_filter_42_14]